MNKIFLKFLIAFCFISPLSHGLFASAGNYKSYTQKSTFLSLLNESKSKLIKSETRFEFYDFWDNLFPEKTSFKKLKPILSRLLTEPLTRLHQLNYFLSDQSYPIIQSACYFVFTGLSPPFLWFSLTIF